MRARVVVLLSLALTVPGAIEPARAACDETPPDLTGFGFTPSSVNTSAAPQAVTCTMMVADDLSGAAAASCKFFSLGGQSQSCTATSPSAGTPLDGTFSCMVTLPAFAEAGTWIAQVALEDAVGNLQSVVPDPFELTVTSVPDSAPPGVTSAVLNPTSVNVSATSQNVTCTMTLTDNLSGVDVAICALEAPDSGQALGCASGAPSSGNRTNGVFSCAFPVPHFADAGAWTPNIFVLDRVGNFAVAAASSLTVVSSPEDILAPALTDFSFTPTSITTGDGVSVVTCSFDVTDNLAGVDSASCTFEYSDPFNPFLAQSQECTGSEPVSGTRESGTFQCSAVIPRYSTGGLWDVTVELVDRLGNILADARPELLDVDCATGDVETTVRFGTKTSLTWEPVAGAERYNVYRGTVSGMIDLNADQLPDGGYGTCRNALDGDLTDTTFADAEVPTTMQIGFHYLVSYTSADVEMGLGSSSFENLRTVAAPCP